MAKNNKQDFSNRNSQSTENKQNSKMEQSMKNSQNSKNEKGNTENCKQFSYQKRHANRCAAFVYLV